MPKLVPCMMRLVFNNVKEADNFEAAAKIDADHSMYIGLPRVRLLNADHAPRPFDSSEAVLYGDLLSNVCNYGCKEVFNHFNHLVGIDTEPNEIYINTEVSCPDSLGDGFTFRATWLKASPTQFKVATISNSYVKGICYALQELEIENESVKTQMLDKVLNNPSIAKIEYYDMD